MRRVVVHMARDIYIMRNVLRSRAWFCFALLCFALCLFVCLLVFFVHSWLYLCSFIVLPWVRRHDDVFARTLFAFDVSQEWRSARFRAICVTVRVPRSARIMHNVFCSRKGRVDAQSFFLHSLS